MPIAIITIQIRKRTVIKLGEATVLLCFGILNRFLKTAAIHPQFIAI